MDAAARGLAARALGRTDVLVLPRAGLLAEYRFEETSGTTAADSSGNGYAATYVGSPTLTGAGFTPNSGTKYATIPDAVWTGWQTAIVVHDVKATSLAGALLGSSNVSGLAFCDASISGCSYPVPTLVYGGSTYRGYEAAPAGPQMLTAVSGTSGSTSDQIYINDHEPPTTPQYVAQGTGSGASRLGTGQIGAHTGASYATNATILYAAFYSTRLTALQIASIYQKLMSYLRVRGNILEPTAIKNASANTLIGIGDSLTDNQTTGATAWTALLTTADTFTISKCGFGGIGIAQAVYSIRQLLSYANAPQAPKRVAVIWLGTNDIASAGVAATVWARLCAAAQQARLLGFKVVLCTMISRTGNDVGKNALNALITANYTKCADALADLAANANIGADGAYANSTYFNVDGIHPKTAGQTIVAGIISTAVDTIVWN